MKWKGYPHRDDVWLNVEERPDFFIRKQWIQLGSKKREERRNSRKKVMLAETHQIGSTLTLPGLSVSKISERCRHSAFKYGKMLFLRGQVVLSKIHHGRWISASVLSSAKTLKHSVIVEYLHRKKAIGQDVYCSCSAFQLYPSSNLCKHMVAVLMQRCIGIQ